MCLFNKKHHHLFLSLIIYYLFLFIFIIYFYLIFIIYLYLLFICIAYYLFRNDPNLEKFIFFIFLTLQWPIWQYAKYVKSNTKQVKLVEFSCS